MEDEIELVPVEGYTTLGRDPVSNAILNTDTTPVSYTHLTLPTILSV